MSKIETTSKVSLKLNSRINLGWRGARSSQCVRHTNHAAPPTPQAHAPRTQPKQTTTTQRPHHGHTPPAPNPPREPQANNHCPPATGPPTPPPPPETQFPPPHQKENPFKSLFKSYPNASKQRNKLAGA